MFFRRRFGRRRIYRKAGLRKRGRGVRKVSNSVRRYVKRAIHRQIENKEIIDYWANQAARTIGLSNNDGTCCRQLLPIPAQGTADNQRIGNQIKVVSGKLKLNMNLLPYDAVYNPVGTPVEIRVIVFRDLSITATQNILGSASFFDTFWRGNATALPMQYNKLDLMLPVNDVQYRVLYDRVVKLSSSSNTSTGPVGSNGYFDTGVMSKTLTINWGKWVKKQIKFNDSSAYPYNDNLYILFQPIRSDGTASSGYKMIETHGVNLIKYEDA